MKNFGFVTASWARALVPIGAVVVVAACGGTSGDATADSLTDSAGARRPESAAAASQPPQRTPAMPDTWENITQAAFDTYVTTTLTFTSAEGETNVPRECDPPASCNGNRTTVDIAPAQGTDGIDPDSLDANGHVVAVLHNDGNGRERRYKIPPNVDKVYWLVTTGRSRFVYFDPSGRKQVVSDTSFNACPHDDQRQPGRRAGFKPCDTRALVDTSGGRGRGGGAPVGPGDPSWISCVRGCCVAAAI